MSAMIQDYGRDTVFMVFHSISPRVECEDFSAWRMLVQQLREYSFFQSLRHFQTTDLPGIVGWNMQGFPFSRR
ncbi:MAG: hypothetical protein KH113_01580 [Bifidobacterium sp.]|uniref:Uncharacterized protein n=1 Tax=Bifidobacterium hominis TaxID=3133177 RepID=A0ABV1CAT7_9BIFI|nr:hypothetical protein [Bifidobacterium sp.]